MEQPLYKIKKLIKELPQKDIRLAEKFVGERQFESLLEIVNSDIYLVQKNEALENPKEKFLNIDLDKLIELKSAVEEYMSYFYTPDFYEEDSWMYD